MSGFRDTALHKLLGEAKTVWRFAVCSPGRDALRTAVRAVALGFLLCVCHRGIAEVVTAGEWPGFRGASKQGWSPVTDGPVHWSNTQNVAWKTRIAGEGHSSPIVWEDSVYVTTALASPRQMKLRSLLFWTTRMLAAVVFAATMVGVIGMARGRGGSEQADRWRIVTGTVVSIALLGGIWVGRTLLDIEGHDVRAWQWSMLILLGCVVVACAACPRRSPAWLGLGLLAVAAVLPAWLWFPDRKELFHLDGPSAAASVGLLAAPALLGVAMGGCHWLARRGTLGETVAPGRWCGTLASVVVVTALSLGFLQFVDANHLRCNRDLIRAIVCLDLHDGRARWSCEGLPGPQRPLTAMNTPATPTPVTDGERVLAWFGSAGLMCVSRDGRLLWTSTELVSEPLYGAASSPVLRDGIVVLVSDLEEKEATSQAPRSWIAAVDIASGKVLWRKARQGHPKFGGYASPVVQPSAGGDIVWVHGWHGVDGYDLRTGRPMGQYAYDLRAHHLVASPALEGDRLVIAGPRELLCLGLANLSEGGDPVLWSARTRGEISSSPVIVGALLFLVDESGLAVCLEVATGDKHWETRLPKRYFASVFAAGSRVYFCSESGRTTVVDRAPELRVLAENDLNEEVYTSFSMSGERLIIRGTEHLYCIVNPPAGGAGGGVP